MSKATYKISPKQGPARLVVLGVLNAQPMTLGEIHAQLVMKKRRMGLLGHRVGELCTLGYAQVHGRRGSYRYTRTAEGEAFLREQQAPPGPSGPSPAPLTPDERLELEHLELVIVKGWRAFIEVGEALAEINVKRLYRATHPTFAAYCADVWGYSRPRAYQLIDAVSTAHTLQEVGVEVPHERAARAWKPVAREIARLPETERRTLTPAAVEEKLAELQPRPEAQPAPVASPLPDVQWQAASVSIMITRREGLWRSAVFPAALAFDHESPLLSALFEALHSHLTDHAPELGGSL